MSDGVRQKDQTVFCRPQSTFDTWAIPKGFPADPHIHSPSWLAPPFFDIPAHLISPIQTRKEQARSQSVKRVVRVRNVRHDVDTRHYKPAAHCHDWAIRTGHAPGGREKAHFNIRVPAKDVRRPLGSEKGWRGDG